ncbi:Zn-dependent hydrolase of beta-lactamase [Tritrichomonas foetus]|uniref:Zn-dependent hydrolase of beta-lactamase n=1 Tax=Tritrichomonas foetus TaxID=1144522 RepID=A0A1J4JLX0_9EUKA|nr:Zn-dependent hydrolase of beta-lactamase [Tritrichomonas foetus]|eukprot:OHS98555.1 Zn-dependent hydrolase of beta-lactamase [Tritrichomonas foetus]
MEYPPEDIIPESLPTYNKDHHTKKGFINNPGEPIHLPTNSIFTKEWLKFITAKRDTTTSLEVHNPIPYFRKRDGIRVYWLGHACCLIQFHDICILTDPVFSEAASPLPFFMKRTTPVPCQIEDLPQISVVVISHDHYDHLDPKSLQRIKNHSPNVLFFAPLLLADMLNSWGFRSVSFDWRQHVVYKGVDFTCFPARHACCRYGVDFRERLWCSWNLHFDGVNVYYTGDTAIGPHFSEVKESVKGKIDLVLLPIGPQEPACWMRVVHLDPVDAYDMAKVLEAAQVIPIHYGTFPLGQEPAVPDLVLLNQVWKEDNLHILPVGEYMEYNGKEFVEPEENEK